MKGLLKNNFFAVCSNVKVFTVFILLLGGFAVSFIGRPFLISYTLLCIFGFSFITVSGIKRESASRWGKYKLTLPIKRTDIVKSYYISQLLWLTVGIIFAGIAISLSWLFHGCPFDKSIDALLIFALGMCVSLCTEAFFFPLFYLGGEEKCDVSLIISCLLGVGITFGIIGVLNYYLEPGFTTVLLGAGTLMVCSLLIFALSYPLTVSIYKKKEY